MENLKTCRNCAESDAIDRETDMRICTKYGEYVGGNNSCSEWKETKFCTFDE